MKMFITIDNRAELSYVSNQVDDYFVKQLTVYNPVYIENHRMGRWQGDTPKFLKFFETEGKKDDLRFFVPRGYVENVLIYCEQNDIAVDIIDKTNFQPVRSPFKFQGKLKEFQRPAVNEMIAYYDGTLCAPTGSGKTVMALYLIAERQQRTLIVVHTKELLHQWIDRINTFLGIPKEDVGIIGDGKDRLGNEITVSLIQSLYKRAENVAPHIGHIVVDECHRVPSRTFMQGIKTFSSAFFLGLSATPYRNDKLSNLIFWYMGALRYTVEMKGLVENGHISPIEVVVRQTFFKTSVEDPSAEYPTMLSELTKDQERNELICLDVTQEAKDGRTCLVLSDRKDHCSSLAEILLSDFNMESQVLTGDVPKDARESIVRSVNDGKTKILIATGQLIGEGFDCKHLEALFLTTPIKFNGRILQYVGRVLRPAEGKEKAMIYDYLDVNIKVLYGSFRARQKMYEQLQ